MWTYLDEATDPASVQVGKVIVAGDRREPFLARVVDVDDGIVHLDVVGLPGDEQQDELTDDDIDPLYEILSGNDRWSDDYHSDILWRLIRDWRRLKSELELPDELKRLYQEEGLSAREIAERLYPQQDDTDDE